MHTIYIYFLGRTDKEVSKKKKGDRRDDYAVEEMVPGDELDLDVKDWKPHMEQTHAVRWVDPIDVPRFEKTFKGNKVEDAPDTISPKYNAVHKKEAFYVDMSKQRGHFDEDMDLRNGDEYMPDNLAGM